MTHSNTSLAIATRNDPPARTLALLVDRIPGLSTRALAYGLGRPMAEVTAELVALESSGFATSADGWQMTARGARLLRY